MGSVSVPNSKDNMAEYRIRDIKVISRVILPIFDKYTLLTSKQFNYTNFRKALHIYTDPLLSSREKDLQLSFLKTLTIPQDYKSTA